jgi:hypothetical protein
MRLNNGLSPPRGADTFRTVLFRRVVEYGTRSVSGDHSVIVSRRVHSPGMDTFFFVPAARAYGRRRGVEPPFPNSLLKPTVAVKQPRAVQLARPVCLVMSRPPSRLVLYPTRSPAVFIRPVPLTRTCSITRRTVGAGGRTVGVQI